MIAISELFNFCEKSFKRLEFIKIPDFQIAALLKKDFEGIWKKSRIENCLLQKIFPSALNAQYMIIYLYDSMADLLDKLAEFIQNIESDPTTQRAKEKKLNAFLIYDKYLRFFFNYGITLTEILNFLAKEDILAKKTSFFDIIFSFIISTNKVIYETFIFNNYENINSPLDTIEKLMRHFDSLKIFLANSENLKVDIMKHFGVVILSPLTKMKIYIWINKVLEDKKCLKTFSKINNCEYVLIKKFQLVEKNVQKNDKKQINLLNKLRTITQKLTNYNEIPEKSIKKEVKELVIALLKENKCFQCDEKLFSIDGFTTETQKIVINESYTLSLNNKQIFAIFCLIFIHELCHFKMGFINKTNFLTTPSPIYQNEIGCYFEKKVFGGKKMKISKFDDKDAEILLNPINWERIRLESKSKKHLFSFSKFRTSTEKKQVCKFKCCH